MKSKIDVSHFSNIRNYAISLGFDLRESDSYDKLTLDIFMFFKGLIDETEDSEEIKRLNIEKSKMINAIKAYKAVS